MAMLRVGRVIQALNLDYRLCQTRSNHVSISEFFSKAIDPPYEIYGCQDMGTFGFARSPWGSMGINQNECEQQDFGMEGFASEGSMHLMAVPKRKVTPSRKRIRNAPKALKPAPLIIRCKSCGRVKLPHFFCCTGDKVNEEGDSSTK